MHEVPQIDIHKAKALLDQDGATFVDIRDAGSHAQAHIPGSTHLGDHNIQAFVAEADRERPVVVYCFHGNMSRGGAAYLIGNGFAQVWSLAGGFEGWRHAYESVAGGQD